MDEEQKTPHIEQPDTLANPYEVLGLTRPATPEDIRAAYFARVKEHPPERDPQALKRIRAAYDALRTPEAKAATDLFLFHHPPEYQPYQRPPTARHNLASVERLRVARASTDLGRVDFRDDYRDVEL